MNIVVGSEASFIKNKGKKQVYNIDMTGEEMPECIVDYYLNILNKFKEIYPTATIKINNPDLIIEL